MLTAAEFDAPARLLYGTPNRKGGAGGFDWNGAREFPTLREAVHVAMTEEAPASQEPYIRTDSGTILDPSTLQGLFDSLQGP